MLLILGFGSNEIKKIRDTKQKHTWSVQVLDLLVLSYSMYEYEDDGTKPLAPDDYAWETTPYLFEGKTPCDFEDIEPEIPLPKAQYGSVSHPAGNSIEEAKIMRKNEKPILMAAKNGITEIVERILNQYPVAVHDINSDKKNIVLLAVENRQPRVYLLLIQIIKDDIVFRQVDNEGNSALHLAAMVGKRNKSLFILGAALQLQWEFKWYEFVRDSMPLYFFNRYNKKGEAPEHIFNETHKDLVETGSTWLIKTSESCTVVTTLIATVAFATSVTIPGGIKGDSGTPNLENQPAFIILSISSLIALSFSVTSVIMFLSILTSRYQLEDFRKDLPRKLFVGLTLLFLSMGAMLVSFCAGHFFVLRNQLKLSALPVYALMCLPVALALAQFPLYSDVAMAVLKKVPQG